MTSFNEDANRIKTGASLLASGGTLTSEPCARCNGVQVRLGDKTTCINCGNEINAASSTSSSGGGANSKLERERAATPARRSAVLTSVASMIEEKIALIASEIRAEDDISLQRQKVELLERYLGILEKTKSLIA
jgi:uncharacterized Zn finger protein (UPF0148 family)